MKDIVIEINPSAWLKKAARSVLLAYLLFLALIMWAAETIHRNQLSFFNECESAGGFITLTEGKPSCTRFRSGGMMQL